MSPEELFMSRLQYPRRGDCINSVGCRLSDALLHPGEKSMSKRYPCHITSEYTCKNACIIRRSIGGQAWLKENFGSNDEPAIVCVNGPIG